MYPKFFKPFLDITIAVILLIIFLPMMFVIMIVLLLHFKKNPFFTQQRVGLNGKIFRILKFRTMNQRRDNDSNLLPDCKRLTLLGKFIRATSLDELPQLINVIKRDMSLVGPRPLPCDYLLLYNDEQRKRHDVHPGITGLAQVNGRNSLSWQQKFAYDIYYTNNISFTLDILIIFKTIKKVITFSGINSSHSITMEKFTGNE